MLPGNVVVRSSGEGRTVVEAFDPDAMGRMAGEGHAALETVAADARQRLTALLDALA